MSALITTANADNAIRLEAGRTYAILTVAWEYTEERLLVELKGARPYTSMEDLVRQYTPRDEGMRVTNVQIV